MSKLLRYGLLIFYIVDLSIKKKKKKKPSCHVSPRVWMILRLQQEE